MSQSIRFLGVAVMAWAGVRAISLGLVPGTQAFAFDLPQAEAKTLPAVQPTQLPPIQPMAPNPYAAPPNYPGYGYPPGGPAYAGAYPVYIPIPAPAGRVSPPLVQYIAIY